MKLLFSLWFVFNTVFCVAGMADIFGLTNGQALGLLIVWTGVSGLMHTVFFDSISTNL